MNKTEMKLNVVILRTIGLSVSEDIIFDQDLITPMVHKGKTLKHSSIIDRRVEAIFCPLSNLDLMKHLFSYFLHKQNMLFGIYYPIIYPYMENGMNVLAIKDQNGKEYKTKPYLNLVLAYMELMLILADGTDLLDLSIYDNQNFIIPLLD